MNTWQCRKCLTNFPDYETLEYHLENRRCDSSVRVSLKDTMPRPFVSKQLDRLSSAIMPPKLESSLSIDQLIKMKDKLLNTPMDQVYRYGTFPQFFYTEKDLESHLEHLSKSELQTLANQITGEHMAQTETGPARPLATSTSNIKAYVSHMKTTMHQAGLSGEITSITVSKEDLAKLVEIRKTEIKALHGEAMGKASVAVPVEIGGVKFIGK